MKLVRTTSDSRIADVGKLSFLAFRTVHLGPRGGNMYNLNNFESLSPKETDGNNSLEPLS